MCSRAHLVVICRDPLRAAGHVVVQILTSDPGREEEVIQKNRPLPPPDSELHPTLVHFR